MVDANFLLDQLTPEEILEYLQEQTEKVKTIQSPKDLATGSPLTEAEIHLVREFDRKHTRRCQSCGQPVLTIKDITDMNKSNGKEVSR